VSYPRHPHAIAAFPALVALVGIALLEACTALSPSPGLSTPLIAQAQGTPETAAIGFASYFSLDQQHPESVVIASVDAATTEVDTAMYSFTYQPIWDAYLRAVRDRHVPIVLVVDATELAGANNGTMRSGVAALCQQGVKVRKDSRSGLMHLKLSEIDQHIGLGGSYNYTNSATKSNDEILIRVDTPKYVNEWRAHILETYNNAADACPSSITPTVAPAAVQEGVEDGG
jgi:phosphatidylserine/phosphatidylglycerophosphate/cardiolipin synthase-like enzyme